MTSPGWYYAKDGDQIGPVTAAQLKKLAETGELTSDCRVWRDGMKEWKLASDVPGLAAAMTSAPTSTARRQEQALAEQKTRRRASERATKDSASSHGVLPTLLDFRLEKYWTPFVLRSVWRVFVVFLVLAILDCILMAGQAIFSPDARPTSYVVGPLLLLLSHGVRGVAESVDSDSVIWRESQVLFARFVILAWLAVLIRVGLECTIVFFNIAREASSLGDRLASVSERGTASSGSMSTAERT